MPIETPLRGAEERVLLADQLAAELRADPSGGSCRDTAPRRRRRRMPRPVLVNTVMNRLSPVSRRLPAPSSAPMMPRLCVPTAVAEDRLHLDAGRHVHHAAGLGDDALARIELDLDELHVLAEDLVVDLVRPLPAARHRRRRRRGEAAGGGGSQLGHLAERRPLTHAGREDQRRPIDLAGAQPRHHVVLGERSRLRPVHHEIPLPCGHSAPPRTRRA